MATAYLYPESQEIHEIEQETLPRLVANVDSPFLNNFPMKPHESDTIRWVQQDNFTGVMQFRGYGGQPNRVQNIGASEYQAKPGVYGEFMALEERELTVRANYATFGKKADISDLIAIANMKLMTRQLNLQEKIIADFVMTGTYSIPDPYDTTKTIFTDTWTPPSFTRTVAWSSLATATPLADMMAIKLVPFGKSVITDSTSTLYINQNTANNLILNRNANDLYGLKLNYGQTPINDLNTINTIFLGLNLPQVKVYDGFYLADGGRKGTATRFIPDNKGILFGRRPSGVKPGEFAITWNAEVNGAQSYSKVIDSMDLRVPRTIEVHRGFNGGPLIEYPGSIVLCNL